MNLFALLGWPSCATKGCGAPGVLEVVVEGAAGPLKAHLCVLCVSKMARCMRTMLRESAKDDNALPDHIEARGNIGHHKV